MVFLYLHIIYVNIMRYGFGGTIGINGGRDIV